MSATILIEVAGQAPGIPGVSREFEYSIVESSPPLVTLSIDDLDGIESYLWEILSLPEGASAVLSGDNIPSPTFTPTTGIFGTYLIRCTIVRDSVEEIGTLCIAFSTPNKELRVPAPGEVTEFGTTYGWAKALRKIINEVDVNGDFWSRISTILSPKTPTDTIQIGDGTPLLPAYSFTSNSNTGFYRGAANEVTLSIGGRKHLALGRNGSGLQLLAPGGTALEYDLWRFILGIEKEFNNGPPSHLQLLSKAHDGCQAIAELRADTTGSPIGNSLVKVNAYNGNATACLEAFNDNSSPSNTAKVYVTARSLSDTGDASALFYANSDQANAYLNIAARTNSITNKAYIRIGYNPEDGSALPDYIRMYTKALGASSWTNKYLSIDDALTGTDWNTLKTNCGNAELPLVGILNKLFDTISGGSYWTQSGDPLRLLVPSGANARIQTTYPGTVTNPAYAFTDKTNTGLFLYNSNDLGITINGVQRFVFSNDSESDVASLRGMTAETYLLNENTISAPKRLELGCVHGISNQAVALLIKAIASSSNNTGNTNLTLRSESKNNAELLLEVIHNTTSEQRAKLELKSVDSSVQLISMAGKGGLVSVHGDYVAIGAATTIGLTLTGTDINLSSAKINISDNRDLRFGTGIDASFRWNTLSAVHYLALGVGSDGNNSKCFVLCEQSDFAIDIATIYDNPTFRIQSADATQVSQYIAISHIQTVAQIRWGSGYLVLGTGTTSRGLSTVGDVFISGKLAVGGEAYFEGITYFYAQTAFNASSNYADKDVRGVKNVTYYTLYNCPVINAGNLTLNWGEGDIQVINMLQSISSLTLAPPGPGGKPGRMELHFIGNGSYTIDGFAGSGVSWYFENGNPPFSIASGQRRRLLVTFDGTHYYAEMKPVAVLDT